MRLGNLRSLSGVALFAFFGAALLTLPAARHIAGLAHPLPPLPSLPPLPPVPPVPRVPHPSLFLIGLSSAAGSHLSPISGSAWSTALLRQYSPIHGGGAWVVAGGEVAMVLPGAAAACAAGWLGATAIAYEYRCGNGLLTFALLPRRTAVLAAKAAAVACIGALLCLGATVFAYWVARLGFRGTGVRVPLPLHLMLAGPRVVALAALCGALGVIGGAVLRARLLATLVALTACAAVAAVLPDSTSLAVPYVADAALYTSRFVPGTHYRYIAALILLLALPLGALVLSSLVAVRRRRVA